MVNLMDAKIFEIYDILETKTNEMKQHIEIAQNTSEVSIGHLDERVSRISKEIKEKEARLTKIENLVSQTA